MSTKRKAALNNNDKLAFLMLCIKHSTTRLTIDFEAVKNELPDCGTKDAAYWRHFRLMKEYGLTASGMPAASGKNGGEAPAKKAPTAIATIGGRVTKKRAAPASNGETRKRKSRKQDVTVDGEDEGGVKAEAEDDYGTELVVKREEGADEQLVGDLARAAESGDDEDGMMEGGEGDTI